MLFFFLPGEVRSLLMVFVVAITGVLVCTSVAVAEIRREKDFRDRYGASWESNYEQVFGAVGKARARTIAAVVGVVAIISIATWLVRHVSKGQYAAANSRRKKRIHSTSSLDRTARAKRNALVGIYFGLIGIACGVSFELFYLGLFSRFEDQQVVGGFIFLAGYVSVLSGCWWWLKAKAQSEALVFIGLMPLAILMIPFVRLAFLASPALVAFSMVMSPIILIVVILVLPDKSSSSHRRHSWETSHRSRIAPEESARQETREL